MSDRVVVFTADVSRLAEDFAKAAGVSYPQAMQKILEDATWQIQTLAQQYAPVRTGELRDTITREVEMDGQQVSAYVIATAPYALYQEFGTGSRGEFPGTSYTIRPRPPNTHLKFKTSDGRTVFAKEVNHPGIPPRPFMRPAAERYFGPIMEELGNAAVVTLVDTPSSGANYQVQTISPDQLADIQAQGAPR